ncbi:DNA-methyltransferase [Streptomyces nigrescens]
MPFSLHQGDALSVLASLPDNSVDAVITDPPYNTGGRTAKERTSRSAKQKYSSAKGLADFVGENMDQKSYEFWLTQILTQAHRVTKDSGALVLFTDFRQGGTVVDALQAAGWTYRGLLAWHKPAARPQKGRFKQDCEFMPWGTKGDVDAEANPVYLPGLYSASQPRKGRQHITQKPVSVMRELVKICRPGGTVLDFCAGSGSTGVAALLEGYDFIGIEKTRHYAEIASDRLTETLREISTQDDYGLAGPAA